MRIHFPVLVLVAMSIEAALGAETPALIDRPNANSGPTQISAGIWVVDINSIDSAQQTFTADIAVVLRWKDPRLAHTGSGVVHYALDQVWNPRVVIVNETNSVNRRLPESVDVDADGTVLYRQRYVGAFAQPFRLNSFPFDKQSFRVQLVAVRYQTDEVKFVPDQAESRQQLLCQTGRLKNGSSSRSCTRLRRECSIRVTPLNSRPRAMFSTTF